MSSITLVTTPFESQTPRWLSVLLKVTLVHWFRTSRRSTQHVVVSFILTIVAFALSGVFAYLFVLKGVNFDPAYSDVLFNLNDTIIMSPDFIAIDNTARTLTTDWYIDFTGSDTECFNASAVPPEGIVNIYFDSNLLLDSDNGGDKEVPSSGRPSRPVFNVNYTDLCQFQGIPTFRTVNKLTSDFSKDSTKRSSLQFYPFDVYLLPFFLFAKNNSTNASVGIVIGESFAALDNFNIQLNQDLSTSQADLSFYNLEVQRSTAVQVLAVIITFANWLVTISFLCITVASMMWPEQIVKDMFVVPIASLFAFTSVRSNMPGAPPGFGAIVDYVGILPNIAIMTLCSATLLMGVLIRRTRASQDDVEKTSKTKKAPATVNNALTFMNGALVATALPPAAELHKTGTTAKASATVKNALIFTNRALLGAVLPPATDIRRRTSTNEAPAAVDGALVPATPPPVTESQRRTSTAEASTIADEEFVPATPLPVAENHRRTSTNEASAAVDGALVPATPPPAAENQRRSSINETPVADGALAPTTLPPEAENRRCTSTSEASTIGDGEELVPATPLSVAENHRRTSMNEAPAADGVLAAAAPPPGNEEQMCTSMNEAPAADGAFVRATPPPDQGWTNTNDAPPVADGMLVAATPPPAAEIQRRTSTKEAPSTGNLVSATSTAISVVRI